MAFTRTLFYLIHQPTRSSISNNNFVTAWLEKIFSDFLTAAQLRFYDQPFISGK